MRRFAFLGIVLIAAGCSAPGPQTHPGARERVARVSARDLGVLHWRWIGPAVMGGRLDTVAGVAGDPGVIYLGHASGGLYRSTDGGMTFDAIFHAGTSSSIGALAVAPSDPRVVYAGTGEGFPRNTASPGDGVFVSRDAGKTWRAAGLTRSEHIAKIAVDPSDPRVAIVAAMGPEWTPGGERGLYRTSDGGAHWTRVLYVNPTTGGSDVTFDPADPSIVYAARSIICGGHGRSAGAAWEAASTARRTAAERGRSSPIRLSTMVYPAVRSTASASASAFIIRT